MIVKLVEDGLKKYATNDKELERLEKFYDLTKGLLKFSKPKLVKEMLDKVENC